ncbi:hypothetical protein B2J88_49460 [Rhodococcus sp. SRB_17]|nr:hypothetical protein [Rhodococcus sp. SRB_17]
MDYEHQPMHGPGVWIGAGLLVTVGGVALLWVSRSASGDQALAVAGWGHGGRGLDERHRWHIARQTSSPVTRSQGGA